jgi:hypothetical protein
MTSGEWTNKTPSLSTPRYGSCSAVVRGEWIVCGGIGFSGTAVTNVESYNMIDNEWSQLPPLLHARVNAACAVFGGRLFVCGSVALFNFVSHQHHDDGWIVHVN